MEGIVVAAVDSGHTQVLFNLIFRWSVQLKMWQRKCTHITCPLLGGKTDSGSQFRLTSHSFATATLQWTLDQLGRDLLSFCCLEAYRMKNWLLALAKLSSLLNKSFPLPEKGNNSTLRQSTHSETAQLFLCYREFLGDIFFHIIKN